MASCAPAGRRRSGKLESRDSDFSQQLIGESESKITLVVLISIVFRPVGTALLKWCFLPRADTAKPVQMNMSFTNFTLVGTRGASAGGLSEDVLSDAMHFILALVALIFLAPLMILVAIAVYAQDRGPVVFAHRRIGRGSSYFPCLKFRSMAVDAERRLAELLAADPEARAEWARDHKLRNDPRVTKLGAFLRTTSLDELPQLINVLRGDMRLVGPRPIVDAEIVKYGSRFRHYCAVKPGITGLWQVSGRSETTYRARVAMDCLYARTHSLRMDIAVIFLTIPAVLARRGSY